jgi:hypothetical protein
MPKKKRKNMAFKAVLGTIVRMPSESEDAFFDAGEDPTQAEEHSAREKLLQCRLYALLLEKYADLINEKEKRTIGEIKALVNKEDLTIQSIATDLKPENYAFPNNYPGAAQKALSFAQNEISYVELEINLNYWLAPKEIFSSKVGDDEDLAVFLCSLLFALEDENASVIIAELDSLRTHAFVATEFGEKFYILDASQKHSFPDFSGTKEEALQKYSFKGAKIKRFLYKFNNSSYEQFI